MEQQERAVQLPQKNQGSFTLNKAFEC